jgi:fucose permease
LVAVAAVAFAVLLAAVPEARSLGALSAMILGVGFTVAFLDLGPNTMITWVFGADVGPYLSGLHFSFGVGAFVGPMIAGWALARNGHCAWAWWIVAALLLPLAAAFAFAPSPAREEPHDAPAQAEKSIDKGLAAIFVGLFFLYGGIEAGFGSWIYQYAVRLNLAETGAAAFLTSVFWGLLGLGRLGGVFLLGRLRPRQLLAVLAPCAVLSLGALLAFHDSRAAMWAGTAGMGLSLSCMFPTMLIYGGRRLSGAAKVSGRVVSLLFVGSSLGGMTLPWLMGRAFEPWGPLTALAFPWFALVAYAGLVAVAWFKAGE